jgi:hypothetical protein
LTEALQLEIRTLKELLDSERDPAGRAFAPLADAYRKAGRIPDALRILRDGISKHPDFVTGHVVAAQLYVEQGLAAEGAIAARRALELDGENVSALKSLLRALDETGGGEEAERVRSLLTTLEPDFSPDWTPSSPVTFEKAPETREAALSPTVAVGSLRLEPSIEAPSTPGPEAEDDGLSATLGGGMIDLSSIGPLPTAELPASALSPDLGSSAELDIPLALPGLDAGLAELTTTVEEPPPGGGADEPMIELATLAPSIDEVVEEVADESVMDLALLAPSVDDMAEDEPVMDLALLAPSVDDMAEDEPVMDLALLAPDVEDEPVMDLAMLAPEVDDEPVMDLAMLAPSVDDMADDEPVMDLAMLAPEADDERVMDIAVLAPEADDEPVMDLAMLAPETDDEPVMDLAMLAPGDEPSTSGVDTVVDVAALAPVSAELEEPVFDLAALAPSNVISDTSREAAPGATKAHPADEAAVPPTMVPDDEPVFELDALAPAETDLVATQGTGSARSAAKSGNGLMAEEEASRVGFVSPPGAPDERQEIVIDLDGLRVEPTAASAGPPPTGSLEVEISAAGSRPTEAPPPEDASGVAGDLDEPSSTTDADTPSDDQGEPIRTRTLAELYAAQGAVKEAVSVLRHLLSESPGNDALTRRIAELESGAPVARAPREEVPAALPGQDDEEVEALARELAESGRGSQETESPFAWTDREPAAAPPSGPTIREYFDGLLKWEPRDS